MKELMLCDISLLITYASLSLNKFIIYEVNLVSGSLHFKWNVKIIIKISFDFN